MKNNIIIDFDAERDPPMKIGKFDQLPLDTGKQVPLVADTEVILRALIVHMRMLESQGVSISELMKSVLNFIEKGVFDATLKINHAPPCRKVK